MSCVDLAYEAVDDFNYKSLIFEKTYHRFAPDR